GGVFERRPDTGAEVTIVGSGFWSLLTAFELTLYGKTVRIVNPRNTGHAAIRDTGLHEPAFAGWSTRSARGDGEVFFWRT
ncbi:MAG: hypothetical protein ACRDTD_31050, partial [Pseudonocardiaceae bacterium]